MFLLIWLLQDLKEIRPYIGAYNPAAASRIAVQITAACDRLEYLPERGRPDLIPGTREIVACWPYVIVYHIFKEQLQILRVWHGAQKRSLS